MFLKLIACEVAFRELCYCAARSPNLIDLEFLSQGYHDNPEIGLRRLQDRIDQIEPERYEAILLGYGLCNNMLAGLAAGHTPLIVPRAHDCITFFLGSSRKYQELFSQHPGTFYYTSGWLEHRQRGGERPERRQGAGLGADKSFEDMVAQYGEDNARYLTEFMNAWTQHYSRGVFIDFPFSSHLDHRQHVQATCSAHGWEYEETEGDLGLLQDLLDGTWDDDRYLRVEPGQRLHPSHDHRILQIAPLAPRPTPVS
jgi:hypothetical protein